jgi:hypothetical protein
MPRERWRSPAGGGWREPLNTTVWLRFRCMAPICWRRNPRPLERDADGSTRLDFRAREVKTPRARTFSVSTVD